MNILKLQDQLKGLPDDALVTYVQNPTGEVPTYLALGELERRKSMREQYQAEQTQAPQTTVAQDLTQPAGGLAAMMGQAPQPQMMEQAPQPQMMAQAPQMMPEAPQAPVQMASGGLAEMDVGEMFNEDNFAGGGIVAFAKGGESKKSYPYEYKYEKYYDRPAAALAAIPDELSLRELQRQQEEAYGLYGVDPRYFEKQMELEKTESAKELEEARKMGSANILFALAEGIGNTPGSLLRGFSASSGKTGAAVAEKAKTEAALKRASRDAIQKHQAAQYAQSIGDAKGAMAAREARNEAIRKAQEKNAELETQMELGIYKADSDAAATRGKAFRDLFNTARDNAINEMKALYPAGAADARFGGNIDKFNAEIKARTEENLRGIAGNMYSGSGTSTSVTSGTTTQKPLTATNKKTNEKIISYDGGVTWQTVK